MKQKQANVPNLGIIEDDDIFIRIHTRMKHKAEKAMWGKTNVKKGYNNVGYI